MQVEQIVRQYLPQIKIMQLATSLNNQPWVCTVHYSSDKDLNLYWSSTLQRRHSQEIKQNPKVTAYVLAHENTEDENYVVGISISGTAELLGTKIDREIGDAYVKKLAKDPNFVLDIISEKVPFRFYRLKPSRIVLFDSKNFPNNPRQEWSLED